MAVPPANRIDLNGRGLDTSLPDISVTCPAADALLVATDPTGTVVATVQVGGSAAGYTVEAPDGLPPQLAIQDRVLVKTAAAAVVGTSFNIFLRTRNPDGLSAATRFRVKVI